MAPKLPIDPAGIVRGTKDRVSAMLSADKTANELVELMRDMHRIMTKLETMVDRVDDTAGRWEHRLGDSKIDMARFERLEQAVLNIERATGGVEAAMHALPKVLRQRIFPERAT
jgi:t-SNARE complex subunit (syntaxin)